MRAKHHQALMVRLSSIKHYLKEEFPKLTEVYVSVPTTEDKKAVLDHLDEPDFKKNHYFLVSSFNKKMAKYFHKNISVIEVDRYYAKYVTLDKEDNLVIGTQRNPYRVYDPGDRWLSRDWERDGKIIPYVCYHSNGDMIKSAFERVIEKIPDGTSNDSVILLFQWKHPNPSRDGYFVTPRRISLGTIIENLAKL